MSEDFVDHLVGYHFVLFRPISVAKYCFIAQKSLSHLDLNLTEYSCYKNRPSLLSEFCDAELTLSHHFICTEEDCRKRWDQEVRRLIYTLHLDLPRNRENRLRNNEGNSDQLGRIEATVLKSVYVDNLQYHIVDEFLRTPTDQRLKFINRYLATIENLFLGEPDHLDEIWFHFLATLYEKRANKNLVRAFLNVMPFEYWLLEIDSDVLEFLLNDAHHIICSRYRNISNESNIINDCLLDSLFLKAKLLLQYFDAPICTYKGFSNLEQSLTELRSNLTHEILAKGIHDELMSSNRNFLLVQVLYTFLRSDFLLDAASDVLCLIWRSLGDAYITLEEMTCMFGEVLDQETLQAVHASYTKVICEDASVSQPRTLAHYCRINIRKNLFNNQNVFQKCDAEVSLSDGISQLGLPNLLQTFLRLEC